MLPIQPIQSFEQLKLLADPRRLAILRILMSTPASLTQIGAAIGEHPAWVRHHLKQLESAGLVELVETKIESGVVEKFYRARAGGLLLQQVILPENPNHPTIVFSGSHDLAVELLAEKLAPHISMLIMPVGSLDGLVSLRQNLCHISGCHLLDTDGDYNLPFVRRLFPDRSMQVLTLAHREQGLIVASGNPKAIRNLSDLTRAEVTFINRNPGSGTRLWLDRQLVAQNISTDAIRGYGTVVRTHTEIAAAIQRGAADVGIGLHAAAIRCGLDFIPLFHERYDLVLPQEQASMLTPLLDTIQTSAFRQRVEALIGYETTHTGEQIPI
jgi:putative molybdopterin biosynthesis protein